MVSLLAIGCVSARVEDDDARRARAEAQCLQRALTCLIRRLAGDGDRKALIPPRRDLPGGEGAEQGEGDPDAGHRAAASDGQVREARQHRDLLLAAYVEDVRRKPVKAAAARRPTLDDVNGRQTEMARSARQSTKRRASLNRARVLRAAIALADQGGFDSLTMRRLANELGVEAMSLYNHVAGKHDLLDGMVDLVFAEIEPPSTEGD
jgi:hypothetical protein